MNLDASFFKSKNRLEVENAALRHQLIVLQCSARYAVGSSSRTAIACSSSSFIVGVRRSSRP